MGKKKYTVKRHMVDGYTRVADKDKKGSKKYKVKRHMVDSYQRVAKK